MLRPRRRWVVFVVGLVLLVAILFVPEREATLPQLPGRSAFAWNQDGLWRSLEERFEQARRRRCEEVEEEVDARLESGASLLAAVESQSPGPGAAIFDEVERGIFELGPLVAACPSRLPEYVRLIGHTRGVVKDLGKTWDMGAEEVRERLYRLLYGGRAALEEAMLQTPPDSLGDLVMGDDEPSSTPSGEILGVTVHSGDVLVSRGGAPTSALIARGNDYAGNFSHVALAHVEEGGGAVSVIEAHIEKGLAVADVGEYLRDTKLRIMVLRLRADLPQLVADPLLPHRAAQAALDEARHRHVPYDFEMDFGDPSKKFCSEVASAAYRQFGLNLWMGMSTISSPGLASWLAAFGVRHFETQEPADLEYDPQLRVVAEWRDADALFADHLDNAVVDAMLEGAERGGNLQYDWYMLPVARLVKLYSWVLNRFGAVGPVPEGMSPGAALRNTTFSSRHRAAAARVRELAEEFRRRRGYTPPYWELVALARHALSDLDKPH